ncbi:aldo/keto reductase [Paracoccus sp. pheM1]|uniref:aldo/keto reductase n=1 Tax=Paracoccus sp. pheM1 TaxID=2831675 RepID=UPI001BDB9416|nr:aldo/keto reductase [Paracoccus sp. pheM1]MBT0782781.1 aldo/keto reductase [Paracoccus sp. pheM1]
MNILLQPGFLQGFGTFPLKGGALRDAIHTAVQAGYRTFDTAQGYENEADTGAALAETGIARDRLCIITKVRPENFSESRFLPSVESSLRALRIDRIDVLLLHWPPAGGDITPSLNLLQKAYEAGLASHIGVSNYTAAMMRQARAVVDVPLVTNQVEFHPLLDQSRLLEAARETGIPLSSYCSLARGEVFKYPLFGEIGGTHGKSAAQVVLRWILQKGLSMNTMSTRPENIRANLEIMDFTLSADEMARIDTLNGTNYRIVDRDRVPCAPVWD